MMYVLRLAMKKKKGQLNKVKFPFGIWGGRDVSQPKEKEN
jgi:hypothetical protein